MVAEARNTDWKRIESAPKDDTHIIVCTIHDNFVTLLYWVRNGWISESVQWSGNPIAWMPLPDEPAWIDEEADA